MKLAWAVGAASATLVVADGVGTIDWRGPLTAFTAATVGAAVERALADQPAEVLLIRLDRAAVAVSLQQMVDFMRDPARKSFRRAGAVVTDEASLPMFRDWCWHVGQLGVIRKAFTSYEDALPWAREMAELARAQAAYLARRERRLALGARLGLVAQMPPLRPPVRAPWLQP
jgi:hypothetical protein